MTGTRSNFMEECPDDSICAFCEKDLPETFTDTDWAFEGFCNQRCSELFYLEEFARKTYNFKEGFKPGFVNDDYAYTQFFTKEEIEEIGLSDNHPALLVGKFVITAFDDETPCIGRTRIETKWKVMQFYPIPGYPYEEDEYALSDVCGEVGHRTELEALIAAILLYEREKAFEYISLQNEKIQTRRQRKAEAEYEILF